MEIKAMVRWLTHCLNQNTYEAISLSKNVFWNAVESYVFLQFWWNGKHLSLESMFFFILLQILV